MSAHIIIGPLMLVEGALRPGLGLLVADGVIKAVLPSGAAPRLPVRRLPEDNILAPGFIDLQVNGGGGLLFNDAPTAEAARLIAAAHRRLGTTAILPTLITDAPEKLATAELKPGQGVLGLHCEGPWLNPQRAGVHQPHHMRTLTPQDAALLARLATTPGARMLVTLAPEQTQPALIAQLVQAGVLVAAGHSIATYEQMQAALAAGLSLITHLYNAMPPPTAREPGLVGAALATQGPPFCGVIADGIHVHPAMLKLAMAAKPDHLFLVSDAMPPTGSDMASFDLLGTPILRREGRLTTEAGTLAGADICLADAVRFLVSLGVELAQALRMASEIPARALGVGHQRGKLATGQVADMVWLDRALQVRGTWLGGEYAGE